MRRWMTAWVLAAGSVLAHAQPATPPTGQLPRTAEPLHYRLELTLDPRRDDFDGRAQIRVRLHQAADHVWLHARGLDVRSVQWSAAAEQGAASFAQVNDDGLARVGFGRVLAAQDIELQFIYGGPYSTRLESIYKVTRGTDSYLVTQFEDIAARRAFPGFDEPAFKTPFELHLTVPEKLTALANTRQVGDERAESGSKTLSFATTEALPTYLVAFAVGPWDQTRAVKLPPNEVRQKPLTLRAFGARGSKPQLAHSLKTTPEILGELERYFGIPYPFDKLDLLAAPDFAFGAMENAGLITFREPLLLLDERSPTDLVQDHYAVNGHELAHQWFGNYATLRWWDDIWLNEAFATWMAAKVMDRLHPEFRAGLDRLDATLGAMRKDSLVSARRIREPILETADIGLGFDAITYQKGAGVLNMFESWIGEEKFRDGIRLFLQRHARGTATSDDLIAALTEASGSGESLARSMRSFLDQAGVPRVAVKFECAKGKAKLHLRQSRYLPAGSRGQQGASWKIPVCLKLGQGADTRRQCFLLEQPQQKFELEQCPDWYLPNDGGSGYYRYAMPAADLERLNARFDGLTPAEQLIHADSIHAGFRRGDLAPRDLLQALPRFAASPLPAVAGFLVEDFNWIHQYFADARSGDTLRRYAIALYQPQLDRLGMTARADESPDATLQRQQLADFLALDLHAAATRHALRDLGSVLWPATGERLALDKVDANLLGSVLAVLVQEGGEPVLSRLMAELARNRDAAQRRALIAALAAVDDPRLAARVREFALDGGLQLREQVALLRAHQRRPANRAEFWIWAQANFERIVQPFPAFAQHWIPALMAGRMCSQAEAQQLQQFMQPRLSKISGGRRAFAQALEGVQLCATLRQRHSGKALAQWAAQQALPTGQQALAEVIAGPHRTPAFRSRDLYRRPQQTLEFFGLKPQMSVVEVWPGAGWYAEILAPYLRTRGRYTAAGFAASAPDTNEFRRRLIRDFGAKLETRPDLYDAVVVAELGAPDRWQPAPPRSVDLVLTFRNVHNWMAAGYEQEMFKAFFEMLKIGGSLGVVEHRAPPGTSIEDMKRSGYVTEEYVIRLAEAAGFKLHGRSEINANPRDKAQHPEGVWTLPPILRLGAQDREAYLAIGESDRMTLKFVKP